MKTQSIIPHPSIAAYVSNIVVIENNNIYREAILPLIANGSPSITFQITDTGLIINSNKNNNNLVLYGQNIKPIELYTRGYVVVIAYFLYPHILKNLFGIDAKELTDIGLDLSLTEPAREMSLKEQLLNATSLDKRLQLMNSYVLKLSGLNKLSINNPISFATQTIQKSKGLISLTNVQKELYVTERTLQRLFEFHVGVSPKTFSRICQFHSALQQLSQNQFSGMADVAYENGYADQSHLIRAFNEFTNCSPLEYLKRASDFPR
ncbi:helix-turn-helix domain-containing protein [Mucilaginibacter sp. OK098]|uniref:helix-turn-helix domain-containing protein n=1 Tax=Mucilaginibacter sp. OK098 TaxID=1855297 RepID=UPI0009237826|nr:helix-turn-helix domain-containing protein [Mucilaginibacter sp. OK098]SHN27538.1 AraC-type DNA-binding protein [Mucilaginibacter sp. OK098]